MTNTIDGNIAIKLETRDGFLISIDCEILQRAKIIQKVFEYCNDEGNNLVLPVPGINHDVLLKILLWLEFHKQDEEPDWVQCKYEPADLERRIDDWDKEFLRESLHSVRAIIKGADYLDIPWLVRLCMRKLRIRGSNDAYLGVIRTIAPIT